MIVTLGWNSSDLLTGSIRELSEKYPNNKQLRRLYKAFASGSDEPITIHFDDDSED